MTRIVYNTDVISITMWGHAKSDEFGHDLVCSALSICKYILQTSLHEAEVQEDDGFFFVAAPPTQQNQSIADAVGNAFALLSKTDFVTFESHGLNP